MRNILLIFLFLLSEKSISQDVTYNRMYGFQSYILLNSDLDPVDKINSSGKIAFAELDGTEYIAITSGNNGLHFGKVLHKKEAEGMGNESGFVYLFQSEHNGKNVIVQLFEIYDMQKSKSTPIRFFTSIQPDGYSVLGGESYEDISSLNEFQIYLTGANKGIPKAQYIIGRCYFNGSGVEKNLNQTIKWWTKAAENGYIDAQNDLGNCYANGIGVEKDILKAEYWWKKAADQGDELAIKNLELWKDLIFQAKSSLDIKNNNDINSNNIFSKNIKSAEDGNPEAQLKIGICYQTGNGVPKNNSKAFEWIEKSAKQGNADAQTCLGLCYGMGTGVEENYAEALKWWRKAANQNDAQAQYYIGMCYHHGTGVSVDHHQAAIWFKKAANLDNSDAQFMMGVYYSTGTGVEENASEAASLWLKAAMNGNSEAQFLIGVCYENGEGIKQDKDKALYWYRKAAENGHEEAKNKLIQ